MSLDNTHGVLDEINAARALFQLMGDSWRHHPSLSQLLTSYDQSIQATQDLMHQVGVVSACAACAAQPRGSCCFSGIETGFDHILLLINLLLGYPLPLCPDLPGSCLFLGKKGCKLRARYYFCVHYLCPHLQTLLPSAAREALGRAVAGELAAGWALECALRLDKSIRALESNRGKGPGISPRWSTPTLELTSSRHGCQCLRRNNPGCPLA